MTTLEKRNQEIINEIALAILKKVPKTEKFRLRYPFPDYEFDENSVVKKFRNFGYEVVVMDITPKKKKGNKFIVTGDPKTHFIIKW